MKRNVTIKRVFEPRTGTGIHGEWLLQDVEVEWLEEAPGVDPYKQGAVLTLNRKMKDDAASRLTESGERVECSIYLSTHEHNGRVYNNLRGFLPSELTEERSKP